MLTSVHFLHLLHAQSSIEFEKHAKAVTFFSVYWLCDDFYFPDASEEVASLDNGKSFCKK